MSTSPIPRSATLAAILVGLALAAPAQAQNATFALATPAGDHRLVSVDEGTLDVTSVLEGAQFQPVQLAGFARLDRLRSDVPVPAEGATPGVHLPGLGSLYRIHQGGSDHLLHLDADGTLALRASVSDGTGGGLVDWIAVRPDGLAALVASTAAAGGNVLLVDLLGVQAVQDLTSSLPPLSVDGQSLRLGPQHAWFVSNNQLYRANLGSGGTAQPVALGLLPSDLLYAELATNQDASCAAAVVEDSTGLRQIHMVDTAGSPLQVTTQATDYDLPSLDSPAGPLLALSSDGTLVAWRNSVLTKKEIFVQPVQQPGTQTQITADADFADTIDNAGILGFVGTGLLIFAAGEAPGLDPDVAIGSADLFLHDPVAGTTQNLTQTSGQATAPFTLTGELEIMDAVLDPLGQRMLLDVDPVNGDNSLVSVPWSGPAGLTTWLATLQVPPQLFRAGDHVLVVAVPVTGGPGVLELHLLAPDGHPAGMTLLGSADASVALDRFTCDRTGTSAAFVASLGPNLELPVWVDIPSATASPLWDVILDVTPSLAFGPTGRLALGVGAFGGPYLFAGFDAPFVGFAYPTLPIGEGFPLSP